MDAASSLDEPRRALEEDLMSLMAAAISLFALSGVPDATASSCSPESQRASVIIDNTFDGTVKVYVDGDYREAVSGDSVERIGLSTGSHTIVVKRNGERLLTEREWFSSGETERLQVVGPKTELLVKNEGRTTLYVQTSERQGSWLSPGEREWFDVRSGKVAIQYSIRTRAGNIERVGSRNVFVEPGEEPRVELSYSAPARATVAVSNLKSYDVSVYIDGKKRGTIRARASRDVTVDTGWTEVVVRGNGRIIETERMYLSKNEEEKVRVGSSKIVSVHASKPTVHVSAIRPGSHHHSRSRSGSVTIGW